MTMRKSTLLPIFIAVAAIPTSACNFADTNSVEVVASSGSDGTRNFDVKDFNKVALHGVDDVEVRTGPFSVVATGDAELLQKLEVRKDGDTLRVGRENGTIKLGKDKQAKIVVTLPNLIAADVAGSGDMTIDTATGDFKAAIAGSGDMKIKQLQGGNTSLSIAGSGHIEFEQGSATNLDISIAGSGDVEAKTVTAKTADISIAGSGDVQAIVSDSASISMLGAGNVTLTGGAKCKVSKVGSGTTNCS